jgi:hypothetical protein
LETSSTTGSVFSASIVSKSINAAGVKLMQHDEQSAIFAAGVDQHASAAACQSVWNVPACVGAKLCGY